MPPLYLFASFVVFLNSLFIHGFLCREERMVVININLHFLEEAPAMYTGECPKCLTYPKTLA